MSQGQHHSAKTYFHKFNQICVLIVNFCFVFLFSPIQSSGVIVTFQWFNYLKRKHVSLHKMRYRKTGFPIDWLINFHLDWNLWAAAHYKLLHTKRGNSKYQNTVLLMLHWKYAILFFELYYNLCNRIRNMEKLKYTHQTLANIYIHTKYSLSLFLPPSIYLFIHLFIYLSMSVCKCILTKHSLAGLVSQPMEWWREGAQLE